MCKIVLFCFVLTVINFVIVHSIECSVAAIAFIDSELSREREKELSACV